MRIGRQVVIDHRQVANPVLPILLFKPKLLIPMIDVKVPSVGESISSGILSKWLVGDGEVVKKDQPLYEFETDKITSEGTAESAGKIALKVKAGDEVKVGQVVATIDSEAQANPGSAPPATAEPPEPKPAPPAANSPRPTPAATVPQPVAGGADPGFPTTAPQPVAGGVDPGFPTTAPRPVAGGADPGPPAKSGDARRTRRKMTPMRARIAQRLVQSQHEAAMLTTFNEVDMSAVMELRKRYQEDFTKKYGVKLGFMSFFTKAAVHALKAVPSVNAQIDGDSILENHFYDIGVAVSSEKGLLVPVIRDCDKLGMAEIEKAIIEAAGKARTGKIALTDLEGGVFTITNGGIFGSMLSTPIINPPQSAILGLHTITDRPVARDGQVVIRPMMYLALSYDHRLIDGKDAVTFLVAVKQAIEEPTRLLLGM